MDIQGITTDYSRTFIHLERYVDQRDYSRFCNDTEVAKQYTPIEGLPFFNLLSLRDERCFTILNSESEQAQKIKKAGFFFVHPDAGYLFNTYKTNFVVCPTSSTRTVFAPHFLGSSLFMKLSLPKRISRFKREFNGMTVSHSLRVSSEVRDFCFRSKKSFGCLHEIAGTTFRGIGCIFREFEPTPKIESSYLIPFFSLYSFDIKKPQEKFVIEQLSELSGIKIREIVEWALRNIICFWSRIALEKGLLLEMHAQNTLLEISKSFEPQRIIVRDFSSVRVDPLLREPLLEHHFQQKVIGVNSHFERGKEYSLAYDYLMGHHFFEPFLRVCSQKFGLNFEGLRKYAADIFHEEFSEGDSVFPEYSYGYTDEVFVNKKPRLKVFERRPLFRYHITKLKGGDDKHDWTKSAY